MFEGALHVKIYNEIDKRSSYVLPVIGSLFLEDVGGLDKGRWDQELIQTFRHPITIIICV